MEGFRIETAYLPAQEVGGDFYQVLEQSDGTHLIVVGDVSGKGLKAAMTGTLAIGAIRALAADGLGPGELLTRLNRQLAQEPDGGFITCACLRVSQSGRVVIANAGHPAPYRNGAEVAVDAGLPLGIAKDVAYAETEFTLEAGETLTLISDGVVEARNANRELFGFDRTCGISQESAERIAATVQQFGQEDDITVLTVMRLATA
jgi:serine phosphatase RsbU (regulator of sigma subunit)